jgi:hypothetical protein
MCRRDIWKYTSQQLGIDRVEEWTYCSKSNGKEPCRTIFIYNHRDIDMAPERPRSVAFDLPLEPRIIDREPKVEVRDLAIPTMRGRSHELTLGLKICDIFAPAHPLPSRPKIVRREIEIGRVQPEYVELREPRSSRIPPTEPPRSSPARFVPLPPRAPSPRLPTEQEVPALDFRGPGRPAVIHAPASPRRQHHRRRAISPRPSSPVREVETIRVRRLEKTDRSKAERRRSRDIEEEARAERERRYDAEDASRRLADIILRERSERRRAERDAQEAAAQRRSAEIAAEDLQRENERLDRQRRLAEREAAVLEREREREREWIRTELGTSGQGSRAFREPPRHTRNDPLPQPDRGNEVIQEAQAAARRRRAERVPFITHDRRIDQDRRG